MFERVFVANRGEIAVRIMRAVRELGAQSVGAMARGDEDAGHLRYATRVQEVAGQDPRAAFLDIDAVVAAAVASGCDALHPGYGFLSESPEFARAVEAAGVAFIGPRPETMEAFGVKTDARRMAKVAGVPTVPGTDRPVATADEARALADEVGFPVAIKASYGGGGRGIRVVGEAGALPGALETARAEAQQAFGRPEVYLEKLIERPRHIEVQVVGDGQGGAVHFFERDCSMQRRNQKLIEESPAAHLDPGVRDRLLEDAVRLARAGRYRSAGTVEFLVSGPEHYFMEVNARLQVEHPVTEAVTGWDLVRLTLQLAAGDRALPAQGEVEVRGHAIECRVNAEDARQGFLPTPGRVTHLVLPHGPGVRVDTAAAPGGTISPHFDSLLAKLIVHGPTRDEARARMVRAIDEFAVGGVRTTLPFHRFAMDCAAFAGGSYSTATVAELGPPPDPPTAAREMAAVVAVLGALLHSQGPTRTATRRPGGARGERHPAMRGPFTPGPAGWFHEL
jgi:acetyl/propionyl-CoA carboxylase alpha subunit